MSRPGPQRRDAMRIAPSAVVFPAARSRLGRSIATSLLCGILREPGKPPRNGELKVRFVDEPLIKLISPAPIIVGLPEPISLAKRILNIVKKCLSALLFSSAPPFQPIFYKTPVIRDSVEQLLRGVDFALLSRQVFLPNDASTTAVSEVRALTRLDYPSNYRGRAVLTMRVGTSGSTQAGDSWDAACKRFLGYCEHFHQRDSTFTRSVLELISFEIEESVVGVIQEDVLNEQALGNGDLASRLVDMARSVCLDCHDIKVAIV